MNPVKSALYVAVAACFLAEASAQNVRLDIEVDSSWNLEDKSNVRVILYEAANHIHSHLKGLPPMRIVVGHRNHSGPVAIYREPGQRFDKVLLTPNPIEYRPQLMYQFAHEYCHVISNFNFIRSTDSKNGWFHESVCELASIFVLHQTGEPALKEYVDNYLTKSRDRLSGIRDFASWLKRTEGRLRRNHVDREANAVIAYRLLPLFIDHPEIWSVFPYLPKSDRKINDYMDDWLRRVPTKDRHLVDLVKARLASK